MLDTLERVDSLVVIDIDWDKEPACESRHKFSQGFCNVKAEYVCVNTCIGISVLWCASRYKEFLKTAKGRHHETCHRPLTDCWKVRPL